MRALLKGLTALGAVLALVPGLARAQDTAPDGYQEAIEGALEELGAERHEESLALFRTAHRIWPNARTSWGLARATFELRRYAESLRHCRDALESSVQPLTDELRGQVEALASRARAFVGRYRLEREPPRAEVLVDGSPGLIDGDGALRLEIGRHLVVADSPGYETLYRSVLVLGGEDETLGLVLRRRIEPQRSGQPLPPPHDSTMADAGLGLLIGATAAFVGAVLSAIWWGGRNDLAAFCELDPTACGNREAIRLERDAALGLSLGLGGLAVVGGVSALVLILTAP